jgi:hypothetical protein
MGLPVMLPTGALASGAYVDYMITYNNNAADAIEEELVDYRSQSTMEDWDDKWNQLLGDVSTDVTTLETAVNKLKIQVRMVQDAINKL